MTVQCCSACGHQFRFLDGFDVRFDEFVRRYEQLGYAVALNLTGSIRDTEEVLARVFLHLSHTMQADEAEDALCHRFIGDIVAAATSVLEQRAYSVLDLVPERTGGALEQQEDASHLSSLITAALQRLPFEYRKVFVLRDVIGLRPDEACLILTISPEDCRARLRRARLMLRRSMLRTWAPLQAIDKVNAEEQQGQKPELLL